MKWISLTCLGVLVLGSSQLLQMIQPPKIVVHFKFVKKSDSNNSTLILIYVAGIFRNQAFPEMPGHFWKCLGNWGNF